MTGNPYLTYLDPINGIDGEHTDMMIGAQHESPAGHACTLGNCRLYAGEDPLHRPGDRRGCDKIRAERARRRSCDAN